MAIKITSKRDGFRRCGIEHVGTKLYPDKHFTREQLKQLKAEPMLVVEQVKEEPAAGETKAEEDKGGEGKAGKGGTAPTRGASS